MPQPDRRRILAALACLASVGLAGCGGSGSGNAGSDSSGGSGNAGSHGLTDAAAPVQGLRNSGNDCAINAVLQLLANTPRLAMLAQAGHETLPLASFLNAYAEGDRPALDASHAALVAAIRTLLPGPGAHAGAQTSPAEVWNGGGLQPRGLGLPLHMVSSRSDFEQALRAGRLDFEFLWHPPRPAHPTTADWSELPDRERLSGLIVNTGGHDQAYLRVDGDWWLADDRHVQRVDASALHAIACDAQRGIELAVYRRHA